MPKKTNNRPPLQGERFFLRLMVTMKMKESPQKTRAPTSFVVVTSLCLHTKIGYSSCDWKRGSSKAGKNSEGEHPKSCAIR